MGYVMLKGLISSLFMRSAVPLQTFAGREFMCTLRNLSKLFIPPQTRMCFLVFYVINKH